MNSIKRLTIENTNFGLEITCEDDFYHCRRLLTRKDFDFFKGPDALLLLLEILNTMGEAFEFKSEYLKQDKIFQMFSYMEEKMVDSLRNGGE